MGTLLQGLAFGQTMQAAATREAEAAIKQAVALMREAAEWTERIALNPNYDTPTKAKTINEELRGYQARIDQAREALHDRMANLRETTASTRATEAALAITRMEGQKATEDTKDIMALFPWLTPGAKVTYKNGQTATFIRWWWEEHFIGNSGDDKVALIRFEDGEGLWVDPGNLKA